MFFLLQRREKSIERLLAKRIHTLLLTFRERKRKKLSLSIYLEVFREREEQRNYAAGVTTKKKIPGASIQYE